MNYFKKLPLRGIQIKKEKGKGGGCPFPPFSRSNNRIKNFDMQGQCTWKEIGRIERDSMNQSNLPIRRSKACIPMKAERKSNGWLVGLHPWIIDRRHRRRQAVGPYLLRSSCGRVVYPPAAGVEKEKAGYLRDRGEIELPSPQEPDILIRKLG
jgi:hypothetical protein